MITIYSYIQNKRDIEELEIRFQHLRHTQTTLHTNLYNKIQNIDEKFFKSLQETDELMAKELERIEKRCAYIIEARKKRKKSESDESGRRDTNKTGQV